MDYKPNTPNYNTRKVSNFSDFLSDKGQLKDLKRSIKPNTNDTQKFTKNSKLNYNKATKKMDDITLPEINDKLDKLEESLENNIKSLSRYITDYNKNNNEFKKRGLNEGISIMRSSTNLNQAIQKINDKIKSWNDRDLAELTEEQKNDIVSGLTDLLNVLDAKVNESKIIEGVTEEQKLFFNSKRA